LNSHFLYPGSPDIVNLITIPSHDMFLRCLKTRKAIKLKISIFGFPLSFDPESCTVTPIEVKFVVKFEVKLILKLVLLLFTHANKKTTVTLAVSCILIGPYTV
jgi:hypothetical protein